MSKPPMLYAIVRPDGKILEAPDMDFNDQLCVYLSEEEAQRDLALWQKPGASCNGRKMDCTNHKVVRYIPVTLGEYHA